SPGPRCIRSPLPRPWIVADQAGPKCQISSHDASDLFDGTADDAQEAARVAENGSGNEQVRAALDGTLGDRFRDRSNLVAKSRPDDRDRAENIEAAHAGSEIPFDSGQAR